MRTKWGQNFLVDEFWQKKILEHFEPPHRFAEIGPGRGALTQHLETSHQGFYVFEIDSQLFSLHEGKEAYKLIKGNFLDWDFCLEGQAVQSFSFVGNLPYESASHMMRRVIENSSQISHFVFLVQKEVAQRIGAQARSKAYSALSILSQGQYKIELKEVIPPGAFNPPPEVDSQILVGWKRETQAHPVDADFFSFVQKSFQQRRKQLSNVWKEYKNSGVFELLEQESLSSSSRAEEIPLELWPKIYECLSRE